MNKKVNNILNSDRYKHLLTLEYDDIVPFVIKYIKKHTFPVIAAWSFLLGIIIWMITFRFSLAGNYNFFTVALYGFAGIVVIPLILVIPHEFLHIIPYFLGGARNIRIGADWKQYYFYVTSHLYPVKRFTFISVALTPFIVISLGIIYLIYTINDPLWTWSLFCALFMHTTMCAGDFALINYYWLNRKKKIITWDDADRREAYFYEDTGEEGKAKSE